jgi:RHS repeat-associated protein
LKSVIALREIPHVTTNQVGHGQGFQYDTNGNLTGFPAAGGGTTTLSYDVENRTGGYWYDLQNQPLQREGVWNLYGLNGERLETVSVSNAIYQINPQNLIPYGTVTQLTQNVYFGGRLIQSNGRTVVTDRQGSVRANDAGETFEYYPYGEEITVKNPQDREKFATYTRESSTGLDYAVARYYASMYGRFNSPDRYHTLTGGAGDPNTPQSWNQYSYTQNDPVNSYDPRGLEECDPGGPIDYLEPKFACGGGGGGGGGVCDPGDPWCSEPCDPGEGNCGGGISHPDPPPPPAPPPSCSIELWHRAAFFDSDPGQHTYLSVTDPMLFGPLPVQFEGDSIGGSLEGVIDRAPGLAAGTGHPSDPSNASNHENGRPFTGTLACHAIDLIYSFYNDYESGPRVPYSAIPLPGSGYWNSNSFTYTLLNDVGLSNYFGRLPAYGVRGVFYPGWGLKVPGL